MKAYSSLGQVIADLSDLDSGEWVYANIESWGREPEDTDFYFIPWDYLQSLEDDQIYLDDEDMEMPLQVQNLGLRSWMLVSSLSYILGHKVAGEHDTTWLIDEINYYRENDTFRT
ncbi:hypothetical protein ABEH28_03500 [Pseudomonas sp. Ps21-P2]|jgi:hypothetical protein|uniref:hypothetical protein n=1 Tax=Pseudomonas sp. Ps21-P2 TaxID=3080331 RepID=UPI00320978A8